MSQHQDEKTGRFKPGNKASPGRKKKAVERDYVKIITDVVSPSKWRGVVEKAYLQALAGDAYARRWLSEYIIGKPPQILELRGGEAAQLAQIIESLKQRGMTPGELFELMLSEIATETVDADQGGDEDDYDDDER